MTRIQQKRDGAITTDPASQTTGFTEDVAATELRADQLSWNTRIAAEMSCSEESSGSSNHVLAPCNVQASYSIVQ